MDHNVHRHICNNGMTVLIIPNDNVDTITVGMYVKTGSRYETSRNNGVAHFLEHMLFKGSKHYPGNKLINKLDELGAQYNAETSYETTCYYISGHCDNTYEFINIIMDIYEHPQFNDNDIITERSVVFEEFNMYRDDTYDIITDFMFANVFKGSTLGMTILGPPSNIKQFDRSDLVKFHKAYYVPSRTVFIVSGNVNISKVRKYMDRKCNKSREYDRNNDYNIVKYRQTEARIYHKSHRDAQSTNIIVGFRSEGLYSNNHHIYEIIADILGSGISSRLMHAFRNELGISYGAKAYNIAFSHEGIFMITVSVDHKHIDKAINKIMEIVSDIANNKVSRQELERVKNYRMTNMALELQTPLQMFEHYGTSEIYYMIDQQDDNIKRMTNIDTIRDIISNISIDDVYDTARALFGKHNMNIVILGAKPKAVKTAQ